MIVNLTTWELRQKDFKLKVLSEFKTSLDILVRLFFFFPIVVL